jgi:glycolate oxidase FAD binding subunit
VIAPEPHALPDLVRELHHQGAPWLPAGLGTRLGWGAPVLARPGEAAPMQLSTARLDRILEHNPGDFTISVEAGVPVLELQEILARQGQWLSLDLPWGTPAAGSPPAAGDSDRIRGGGSVGGLVARGLAGGYRQRYLGVRDQLIGLQLLRADGVSARAGGKVVKNVAGYDLMRLFTGSWGSLGLITAVSLRTMPLPPQRRGLVLQGPLAELGALAQGLLQASLTPERIDWWNAALAAAAGLPAEPALVIGLFSISTASLDEQVAAIRAMTSLSARSLAAEELQALLATSRSTATARSTCGTAAGGGSPDWLLRLGASPDRLEQLLAAPELEGFAVDLAAGSGLGLAWQTAETPASGARVERLRQHCRRLQGHLSVLLQPAGSSLPAWEDAPARPLIEAIKRQFDPKLQLAPGRLPGVAAQLLSSR